MHHILIVEDEPIIRSALRRLLERNTYQVSEAGSVQEAQERYNIQSFDLIISDLRLPGAPGTEMIKLAEPKPVLIMTSYASLRTAVDSMRLGAIDYIAKPFDHDEMLQTIARIIHDYQLQVEQDESGEDPLLDAEPTVQPVAVGLLQVVNDEGGVSQRRAPVHDVGHLALGRVAHIAQAHGWRLEG